jgi:hypothetical protein
MNALPHKPGDKSGGFNLRLALLGVALACLAGYLQSHRADKIADAEAEMLTLEQLIKREYNAKFDDEVMLKRLSGERKTRLEATIASESQRLEAWNARRRDLEVTIREWKAERRALEGKRP